MLLRRSDVREVDMVLDASFIKAWSIRHPRDSRRGFSDPDARVGRHGRGYDLGYKLHVSVDPRRILSLACVLAPANDNEKKHGPALVERTREVLKKAGVRLRSLVSDSQYSARAVDAAYAFLKTQYGMRVNKVRGLGSARVVNEINLRRLRFFSCARAPS